MATEPTAPPGMPPAALPAAADTVPLIAHAFGPTRASGIIGLESSGIIWNHR